MISIIIPVYNEEGVIGNTIRYLKRASDPNQIKEIIVVDGGSGDKSVDEASKEGARIISARLKGRAAQMNEGARVAEGNILYFLHADTIPPQGFTTDITEAVSNGYPIGCYRLRFDLDHWFLKANTWFTRFDVNAFRYGDQSLFVTKEVFTRAGGFRETHIVMEDNEIIKRLRKHGNFVVVPKEVRTSARKYVNNGVLKMQGIFYLIYLMYQIGCSQEQLLAIFRRFVQQDKI
jgi:rSAM/selenodomain-associated transferase 2